MGNGSHMGDFNGGKGLDLEPRPCLVQGLKESRIVREVQIRMASPHQVNFSEIGHRTFSDLSCGFFGRHGVSVRRTGGPVKCTESTTVFTDIGIVQMVVGDKEGLVPIKGSFDPQGQLP